MPDIVDPTSNGYVPIETVSRVIAEVNNMRQFLRDIGYEDGGYLFTDTFNLDGNEWVARQRGADDFRILTVRVRAALKKTNTHPNVVIPLSRVMGRGARAVPAGWSYDNFVLTPSAETAEAKACNISLQVIGKSPTSVTVKVYTPTAPTKDTTFVINMIAIANEAGA